jgi:UDP-N-acetylglucosamine 2-epimerase (non-hydrolysing)
MAGMEHVLREEMPDWVLVQGDTTSVIAVALAAFYEAIKVGHIEAGLRTADKWQPFPEEINRRVVSVIADLHFAPTPAARENLIREGIPDGDIMVTGNTVIDALLWAKDQPFDELDLPYTRKIILVTAHRRENIGEPLDNICQALKDLAAEGITVVFPVHPNPKVREQVYRNLEGIENIILYPPLEYSAWVYLMSKADLILTDSGGIQEEGPALGTPVLVLRDVTERPEAVEAGAVRLVGTDRKRIVEEAEKLLNNYGEHESMAQAGSPYGDGRAAERIVSALL